MAKAKRECTHTDAELVESNLSDRCFCVSFDDFLPMPLPPPPLPMLPLVVAVSLAVPFAIILVWGFLFGLSGTNHDVPIRLSISKHRAGIDYTESLNISQAKKKNHREPRGRAARLILVFPALALFSSAQIPSIDVARPQERSWSSTESGGPIDGQNVVKKHRSLFFLCFLQSDLDVGVFFLPGKYVAVRGNRTKCLYFIDLVSPPPVMNKVVVC